MAQTTDIIDGRLVGFYNGANLIAAATGCSVKVSQATRNSSNKDSSKWEKTLSGRIGWSISGNGKFRFDATHGVAELFDALVNQTVLTVLISTQNAGDIDYGGAGLLQDLSLDFPDSADSTYSFTFKGDGALTKSTH
jgi:predicted secreted protein